MEVREQEAGHLPLLAMRALLQTELGQTVDEIGPDVTISVGAEAIRTDRVERDHDKVQSGVGDWWRLRSWA